MNNDDITKIYGIYPGSLKDNPNQIEYVNNCSEPALYSKICSTGFLISQMKKDLEDTYNMEDIVEAQYAFAYCLQQTKRFGVELPEPQPDSFIEITPSFKAWYNWWDDYFQHELTDEQYKQFSELDKNNKDTSTFRPAGDWRDTIEEVKTRYN